MDLSQPLEEKFVLTGPLQGRTINLGNPKNPFKFEKGVLRVVAAPQELALYTRFLERNWQAFPENHPKAQEVLNGQRNIPAQKSEDQQPVVSSGLQSDGTGAEDGVQEQDDGSGASSAETGTAGSIPAWDGQPEGLIRELNEKLLRAVKSLDSTNDSHWTQDGKPAMTAVGNAYGATDITRSDVEAVAPGYTRTQAMNLQQSGE